MIKYNNASKGLWKMFIAVIGIIAVAVLTILISFFSEFVSERYTLTVINTLVVIVLMLSVIWFSVFSLVGIIQAGRDIDGFKIAEKLTIIGIIVKLVGEIKLFSAIAEFCGTIIGLAIVYYICTSVAAVLDREGYGSIAKKGERVWKINLICTVISAACAFVALIPSLLFIAKVTDIIASLATLYADVLYLIFLKQSSDTFACITEPNGEF